LVGGHPEASRAGRAATTLWRAAAEYDR
jgi:hypothetical protein